jgi:y4mF family transcriptional regulator
MRISSSKDLGLAIRKRRKELGYTQADLASLCNCSVPFISALENGKPTAELERSLRVVNTLAINLYAQKRNGDDL